MSGKNTGEQPAHTLPEYINKSSAVGGAQFADSVLKSDIKYNQNYSNPKRPRSVLPNL